MGIYLWERLIEKSARNFMEDEQDAKQNAKRTYLQASKFIESECAR